MNRTHRIGIDFHGRPNNMANGRRGFGLVVYVVHRVDLRFLRLTSRHTPAAHTMPAVGVSKPTLR